jgi:glutamate formiminotransferase / formiminotetrahydrofolate cyclodeaminase
MPSSNLIECVPNISEGKNLDVVNQVVAAATGAGGCILDVYSGESTNRSVITMVGTKTVIMEAAFQVMKASAELIDMRVQKGTHPRMGSTDVCPFIPLAGSSMTDAQECARSVAERAWSQLGIPIYFYAHSAASEGRSLLSAVRKGEYESLNARVGVDSWKPDVGQLSKDSRSGATAMGARDFLIAYNINLSTSDLEVAKKIAYAVRESGVPKSGARGKFSNLSAIGWVLAERNIAQVSTNIRNFRAAPPHLLYETCATLAKEYGASVCGSELVGLIPKEALLEAGRYSSSSAKLITAGETELLNAGIEFLGLSALHPFDARRRVLEYRLEECLGITL